jgi:hypothetical protein
VIEHASGSSDDDVHSLFERRELRVKGGAARKDENLEARVASAEPPDFAGDLGAEFPRRAKDEGLDRAKASPGLDRSQVDPF